MRPVIATSFILFFCAGIAANAKQKPEMIVINSENLAKPDTILVFSPRKTPKGGPKNTLILLAGRSGSYRSWPSKTDLQKVSDKSGFRIICPDGFKQSWYLDNPGGMQWRTFFWEELWPELKGKYTLDPDHTFIDGLSMGGHGAMNIFLDHPEHFRGAGSMSGVLNLTHSDSPAPDLAKASGRPQPGSDTLVSWSAVTRLPRLKEICGEGAKDKILLVSCGSEDRFSKSAKEFAGKCDELNYRYLLMLSPGKHKWSVWVWTLNYHLDWFTQVSEGGNLGSD